MTDQFGLFPKERAAEQAAMAFPSPAHAAAHPLAGRYDKLIAAASRYVPPGITVEMCRHPSVIMPTFWLFRDGLQVAAAVLCSMRHQFKLAARAPNHDLAEGKGVRE